VPVQISFVQDDALGYRHAATVFRPGAGLRLDDSYRLCHLPLVNPLHPDVIRGKAGTDYSMGVHGNITSLVAPVPQEALDASAGFNAMSDELRASPLTAKIAWDVLPRRASRLHATLGVPRTSPIADADLLSSLGPLHARVGGPFSGSVNVGRLYLKLYPCLRGGENAFHTVQKALGMPPRDLYLVGLWNLTDHLNSDEAAWLSGWLQRWTDAIVAEICLTDLWLLTSRDDLVLDARVDQVMALT
jgi:hypothetical protein